MTSTSAGCAIMKIYETETKKRWTLKLTLMSYDSKTLFRLTCPY